MHILDNHINNIEPRIKAIYNNGTQQEEISLQESLAAYGWVLLDSWVAWRTMRFLIKDMDLDDTTCRKWFQTPGSYTTNQLKGVWNFCESTTDYVNRKLGKSLKNLFDDTIQKKRNSAAHFNGNNFISGSDCMEIKKIFLTLSDVFVFHEFRCFLNVITNYFDRKGYSDFKIIFADGNSYILSEFSNMLEAYSESNKLLYACMDKNKQEYGILFDKSGCKAGKITDISEEPDLRYVSNEVHDIYYFTKNKGYYRVGVLFVESVEKLWK